MIKQFIRQIASRARGGRDAQDRNSMRYYITDAVHAVAVLFCTGTVLQTFLKTSGVSDAQIGALASAANLTQAAVFIVFGGMIDRVSRIRRATTAFSAAQVLLPLVLLSFLLTGHTAASLLFSAVLLATVFQNILGGLKVLLSYRFLYQVIDQNRYGRLFGIDGIITGVTCAAAGILLTVITARASVAGYRQSMLPVVGTAAVCYLLTAFVNSRYEVIFPDRAVVPKRGGLSQMRELLKSPSFRKLVSAFATRGLSSGAIGFMAVYGMSHAGLTETETPLMVIAAMGAAILGSWLYKVLRQHFSDELLTFWGNAGSAVGFVFMLLIGGKAFFIGFYFLAYLGLQVVNCAVPVLVYDIVPPELMGAYTAGRSMVCMAGMSVTTAVLGILSGRVAPQILMTAVACLFIVSGVFFLRRTEPLRKILKGELSG
ncbi:MAG: MFS transporter [Oscillospiraceae bacterium]|jgi:MFS family permease|nr:MFS transporter [Oscillospiraceae bacterium]